MSEINYPHKFMFVRSNPIRCYLCERKKESSLHIKTASSPQGETPAPQIGETMSDESKKFQALRDLYKIGGMTFATYRADDSSGGNVVTCRLCGEGSGRHKHFGGDLCPVERFEAKLEEYAAAPPETPEPPQGMTTNDRENPITNEQLEDLLTGLRLRHDGPVSDEVGEPCYSADELRRVSRLLNVNQFVFQRVICELLARRAAVPVPAPAVETERDTPWRIERKELVHGSETVIMTAKGRSIGLRIHPDFAERIVTAVNWQSRIYGHLESERANFAASLAAVTAERDGLKQMLENIYMTAKMRVAYRKHPDKDQPAFRRIMVYCESGGCSSSVLRDDSVAAPAPETETRR